MSAPDGGKWLTSGSRRNNNPMLLAASWAEAANMLAPAPAGEDYAAYAGSAEHALPPQTPNARRHGGFRQALFAAAVLCAVGVTAWAVLIVRHLHKRPHPEWIEAAAEASREQLRINELERMGAAGGAVGMESDHGINWASDPTWQSDTEIQNRVTEEWMRKHSLHNRNDREDEAEGENRRVFVDFRPEDPKIKDHVVPGHGTTGKTGTRAGHDIRDILRNRGDGIHGSKSGVPKRVAGQYVSWMNHAHEAATGIRTEPTDPTMSRVRANPQLGDEGRTSNLPEAKHETVSHDHHHAQTHIHEAWLGKGGGKKSGSSGGGIETVKNEHISSLGFGEVTGHAHKRSFGTPLTRKHAIAEMIAPHKWKVRGQGSGRR
ncbi:hypothetical protein NFJ02_05g123770 [Pycnococcus provasolii]